MSPFGVIVILAALVVHHGDGRPAIAKMNAKDKRAAAQGYLGNFGYLGKKYLKSYKAGQVSISDSDFVNAISKFQIMFGMKNVTGVLDTKTVEMMDKPRCGVPDIPTGDSSGRRRKRYVLGPMWEKLNLTYKIINTPDMYQFDVASIIAYALKMWSDVTPLTFLRVYGSEHADIDIRFVEGDHGDGTAFDGIGGTLAHAFKPPHPEHHFTTLPGDAHFDKDETWTAGTSDGTDLLNVATHEFGHSLGLGHSELKDAVMFAFYRSYDPYFELHTDDIEGIHALYGPPLTTPPVTEPPLTTDSSSDVTTASVDETPQLCTNRSIDSITVIEGQTYVFQGALVYKLKPQAGGIMPCYPRLISEEFPGVPTSNLDVVMFLPYLNETLFLKGDRYWLFKNRDGMISKHGTIAEALPRLTNLYPVLSDYMDAGIMKNNRCAFIKDLKVYYDCPWSNQYKFVYYKLVYLSKGPKRIDAAFEWTNGHTYFFVGAEYYQMSFGFYPEEGYPKPSHNFWFGCQPSQMP